MTKILLSLKSVADALDISVSSVQRRVKDDPQFPKPIRIDNHVRWVREEIDNYIHIMKGLRDDTTNAAE